MRVKDAAITVRGGAERVLFVSSFSPLRATSGAAIRARQMLEFLGSRYRVDVLFEGSERDRLDEPGMKVTLGEVITVPRPSRWRRWTAPLSTLPFHHATMDQRGFARAVRVLADTRSYSFVWLNKTWLYQAIRSALPQTPVFLEQHAAERDVWENLAHNDPRPLVRLYARWNGSKVIRYERSIYPTLAGAVSISPGDADVTRATYPPIPLVVVPVAVDCTYYQPSGVAPDPHLVLFSGGEATRNVEAMRRFVTRIAPHLRRIDPRFRLLWIGKVDAHRHDFLREEAVSLTGYVPHVPEYFDRGAIFVAPFDMGEGVKVKIVEALAMGKLIVSTRVGVRGLDLGGAPFVRIEDDDRRFADAVASFANDPRRLELAAMARQYALEHFDARRVMRAVPPFIEDALAQWNRSGTR